MPLHDCCTLAQLLANLKQPHRWAVALGFTLLLGIGGCETPPDWMGSRDAKPIELAILQIDPESSGSYTISGSTTLPDRTQITVYAVRYFNETANRAEDSALNPTRQNYAILDRQFANVNQGTWETRLAVQTLVNGQPRESWQSSTAPSRLTPEPGVVFLAMLEPANQPHNLQKQIENQAGLTRFTTDGERYLQAAKTLELPVAGEVRPVSFIETRPIPVKVSEIPDNQPALSPRSDLPIPLTARFR
jgi:hypothetical protein